MPSQPLWKYLLIWGIVLWGLGLASPNLFYARVEAYNDARAAEEAGEALSTAQKEARAAWPSYLPSSLVNLGLDLRGGAHLLAEVHVEDVYAARMDALWPELRDALRAEREAIGAVRRAPSVPGVLRISIEKPEGMARALEIARGLAQPVVSLTGIGANDLEVAEDQGEIVVQLSEAERAATDERTVAQSLEIIRRRVDEVGTREPTIQRQGADRITIQVPGIGSVDELKALIGTTAKLTFHPVVRQTNDAGADPGPRNRLLPSQDESDTYIVIEETPVISGEDLTNAQPAFDQNGRPAVEFQFNTHGARVFGEYTANNIGKPFAIVLDEVVISAPVIQSAIPGGRGIITGSFTVEASNNLAVLLRAGALPAEMTFLEGGAIGAELGADSVAAGQMAAIVGLVIVGLYMVASYGWFGMMANIALLANIVLIFGLLSVIGATLTLPGIAGIVLTIGIAVDANVLIYERIREELRQGIAPGRAIDLGFERAFSAIMDSNVTAIITAVIMFWIGSGAVRGFAVTLGIGILTSMFTAVYVTRAIIEHWMAWKKPKTIVV